MVPRQFWTNYYDTTSASELELVLYLVLKTEHTVEPLPSTSTSISTGVVLVSAWKRTCLTYNLQILHQFNTTYLLVQISYSRASCKYKYPYGTVHSTVGNLEL